MGSSEMTTFDGMSAVTISMVHSFSSTIFIVFLAYCYVSLFWFGGVADSDFQLVCLMSRFSHNSKAVLTRLVSPFLIPPTKNDSNG